MGRTGEHGARSVVEGLLSRSGGGDPERIAELYAGDVDWRVDRPESEHRLVPWISGPDAVVFGRSSQVVTTTGERFEMTFALRLTVEGGLITRHHMYEDSLAVLQAFGRAPCHG